jgi:hypothetical protein
MKLRTLMNRRKFPHLGNVLFGFVSIADGVVSVVTLGRYYSGWPMRFAGWRLRQEIADLEADEKVAQ